MVTVVNAGGWDTDTAALLASCTSTCAGNANRGASWDTCEPAGSGDGSHHGEGSGHGSGGSGSSGHGSHGGHDGSSSGSGHDGDSSGNGHGDHGGGGHGGCDMMMGCGNMNCPSSMAFMTENMVMHTGMVSPSNLFLPFPPVVPLLTTVPPPHAPCSPTTGCCLHTAGRCRRSRCTASPRAVSCGVLLAPQASAV